MSDDNITLDSNNSLLMIGLRQLFYMRQVRLVIIATLLSIVLNAILLGIITYFMQRPVRPIYFAIDNSGKLIIEAPLQEPNMNDNAAALWVKQALEKIYNYDFLNYRSQLQNAQQYFTDYGWRQYSKSLTDSNNLLALSVRKMLVSGQVVAQPTLIRKGLISGKYAWKFSMPLLVTYSYPPYDKNSKFSNPLMVTVIITRQSLSESNDGIGIIQMIANIADNIS